MSNEQKLLPCPFCGGKAYQGAHLSYCYYYVNCADCGIDGPSGVNEQKAAEAWNTRTDTSQQFKVEDDTDSKFWCVHIGKTKTPDRVIVSTATGEIVSDTSQQQEGNDLSDLTFELMQLFIAEKNQRIQELKQQNEFLINAKDEMVQRACADYELAISELQQQLAQHEWVSVEDKRKPAEKVHVFIYGVDGTVAIGKYWADIQKWLVADPRVATGLEVTHWKPITPPNNSGE